MHWILQKNFNKYYDQWVRALNEEGESFSSIEIQPFSEELPVVDVQEPCIAYGTTSLMKNAKKQWTPGVFFEPSQFQVSTWQKIFGKDLLNHDGYLCKLNYLLVNCPEELFIRPNNDLKDFTGVVVKREDLMKQIQNINNGGFLFDGNIEVFVSKPKHLQKEFRFFVVDGKVVTGCQYKLKTMAYMNLKIDKEVEEFAKKIANKWTPAPACVMDIAVNMEGESKLLEFNCFNASGIYICELNKIIQAIKKLEILK